MVVHRGVAAAIEDDDVEAGIAALDGTGEAPARGKDKRILIIRGTDKIFDPGEDDPFDVAGVSARHVPGAVGRGASQGVNI